MRKALRDSQGLSLFLAGGDRQPISRNIYRPFPGGDFLVDVDVAEVTETLTGPAYAEAPPELLARTE